MQLGRGGLQAREDLLEDRLLLYAPSRMLAHVYRQRRPRQRQ